MDSCSPAMDLRSRETRRARLEAAITALCGHYDKHGALAAFNLLIAEGLIHGRPDGASIQAAVDEVRMEFGRRRRAQLFTQGWIV